MSQPPLSSDPAPDARVTERNMRAWLDGYLAEDTQPGFGRQLLLRLQDPFKRNENGGFRLNPLWIGLVALAGVALAVFLYFNFARL